MSWTAKVPDWRRTNDAAVMVALISHFCEKTGRCPQLVKVGETVISAADGRDTFTVWRDGSGEPVRS